MTNIFLEAIAANFRTGIEFEEKQSNVLYSATSGSFHNPST